MPWEILFPHKITGNQTTEVLPVVDGMCVVSGVGPPGQRVRRLFAELIRTDSANPADAVRLIGLTVRSQEVQTNSSIMARRHHHQWTAVFDFGTIAVAPQGTYRIDLYVASGVAAPVRVIQLDMVKLDTVAVPTLNAQYGPIRFLRAGTIYPTQGSTMSASGLSAYGIVTVPSETVTPGGVDVNGTPAASGGMMPNGFWWVNFNPLTPGAVTLTVNSSVSPPEQYNITLQ
jgi:hypothetical protein